MRILVAVASKHGSTWGIARAIGDTLAACHVHVDVMHMEDAHDLAIYDGFVLGSAVYAGHWLAQASAFLHDHAAELTGRPLWLFSSGPVGFMLKPSAHVADIPHFAGLVKFKEHRVFAGCVLYGELPWTERMVSRALHVSQGDYRDWVDIQDWAKEIASSLMCLSAHKKLVARGV